MGRSFLCAGLCLTHAMTWGHARGNGDQRGNWQAMKKARQIALTGLNSLKRRRNAYSRLPNSCSNIMNMLIKFRYRLSAPMIPDFASHSWSP